MQDFEVIKVLSVNKGTDDRFEKHREESMRWHSPEVLGEEEIAPNAKADVWSFGMVMFELFSGTRPYNRIRAPPMVLNEIRAGAIPDRPSSNCPWLTDEVWDLVMECLARNPYDRPTMGEVEERLSAAADAYDLQPPEERDACQYMM